MQPGAHGYVFGSAEPEPELARLAALAEVYGAATEAWLDSAGVTPGMTVVDLGCGPGAVTLAVAARVGPTGRGVGPGGDDRPLEPGRRRAAGGGVTKLRFGRARPPPRRPTPPLGRRR